MPEIIVSSPAFFYILSATIPQTRINQPTAKTATILPITKPPDSNLLSGGSICLFDLIERNKSLLFRQLIQ